MPNTAKPCGSRLPCPVQPDRNPFTDSFTPCDHCQWETIHARLELHLRRDNMPMDRSKYPFTWDQTRRVCAISTSIRFGRARGRCENCGAEHGFAHPQTGSRVVLTTHHINHDKMDSHPGNLLALCQLCHLAADMEHHIQNRRANIIANQLNAGQTQLPNLPPHLAWETADMAERAGRITTRLTAGQLDLGIVATDPPPAGRGSPSSLSPPDTTGDPHVS